MGRALEPGMEQVRGLFVLGFLAILVVVRDQLGTGLSPYIPVSAVVGYLLLLWGFYAFLMAIAVSRDVFKRHFCDGCARFARFVFYLGVVVTFYLLVTAVLSLLTSLIAHSRTAR